MPRVVRQAPASSVAFQEPQPAAIEDADMNGGPSDIPSGDVNKMLAYIIDKLEGVDYMLSVGFARQLKADGDKSKAKVLGLPGTPAALFKAIALNKAPPMMSTADDASFVANRVASAPPPPAKVSAAGVVKNDDAARAASAWKSLTKDEKKVWGLKYAAALEAIPMPEGVDLDDGEDDE